MKRVHVTEWTSVAGGSKKSRQHKKIVDMVHLYKAIAITFGPPAWGHAIDTTGKEGTAIK